MSSQFQDWIIGVLASATGVTIDSTDKILLYDVSGPENSRSKAPSVEEFFLARPFAGCIVELSADIPSVNPSAGYNVVWDSEVTDPDNMHSGGTITIPTKYDGYMAQVSVCLSLELVAADNYLHCQVNHNSSNGNHIFRGSREVGSTTPSFLFTTPEFELAEGDTIVCRLASESDTSVTVAKDINGNDSSRLSLRITSKA